MAQIRMAMLISDHGWGHLNRSLVLASELAARGHPLLLAVSPAMEAATRHALPETPAGVEVVTGDLDRGYAFGARGAGADRERSRGLLRYALDPDPAVVDAARGWRPDLVFADATPWGSMLAEECGVPSVICSNFSWDDQYEALFRDDAEAAPAVAAIRAQVQRFSVAFELPLGPGVPHAPERRPMPLLGRRPSGAALPFALDRPILTWAFGRTVAEDQPLDILRALGDVARSRGLRIVANEAVAAVVDGVTGVPDETPWADLLAVSRIVVTKAGYSTVAEALRGAGHVVGLGITGLPEEEAMLAQVEAGGFGLGVPLGTADLGGVVCAGVERLLDGPERVPVADRAEGTIANALEELAATG